MIFSADPEKAEGVDVVVVELKRRDADDKEGPYAATQLAKRARKLSITARILSGSGTSPSSKIDDALSQLLADTNWTPLFSRGRVFYQDFHITRTGDGVRIPTPTCLLSYDAVISDAAARNHTFLELSKRDIKNGKSVL